MTIRTLTISLSIIVTGILYSHTYGLNDANGAHSSQPIQEATEPTCASTKSTPNLARSVVESLDINQGIAIDSFMRTALIFGSFLNERDKARQALGLKDDFEKVVPIVLENSFGTTLIIMMMTRPQEEEVLAHIISNKELKDHPESFIEDIEGLMLTTEKNNDYREYRIKASAVKDFRSACFKIADAINRILRAAYKNEGLTVINPIEINKNLIRLDQSNDFALAGAYDCIKRTARYRYRGNQEASINFENANGPSALVDALEIYVFSVIRVDHMDAPVVHLVDSLGEDIKIVFLIKNDANASRIVDLAYSVIGLKLDTLQQRIDHNLDNNKQDPLESAGYSVLKVPYIPNLVTEMDTASRLWDHLGCQGNTLSIRHESELVHLPLDQLQGKAALYFQLDANGMAFDAQTMVVGYAFRGGSSYSASQSIIIDKPFWAIVFSQAKDGKYKAIAIQSVDQL